MHSRCYPRLIVGLNDARPIRRQTLVAFACLLAIFGISFVHCTLLTGEEATPHLSHHAPAAGQTSPGTTDQHLSADDADQHPHVDNGSAHHSPDTQAMASRPRTDNPLRLLGSVGEVIAAAVFTIPRIHTPSRGPPSAGDVSAQSGRSIVQELCINRC